MVRLTARAMILGMAVWTTGCTTFPGGEGVVDAITPPTGGYADGSESSDPWIAEAAAEGRYGQRAEKVNDPLKLRRFFMSEKARDIEANVGIIE